MTEDLSELVATYITPKEKEKWDEKAEEMGMGRSPWIRSMVYAGQKKFDRKVSPDETRDDLRRKRNDLLGELKRARDRIETLEEQLNSSDRQTIVEYVDENPGCDYGDIVQHLVNTANARVTVMLDKMEGESIEFDEQGRVYAKR
jgi:predicted nuclease with TOPRIM domain